jgi:hypothetical protein
MGTGRTDEFRKDAVRIALTSGLHIGDKNTAVHLGNITKVELRSPFRRSRTASAAPPSACRRGLSATQSPARGGLAATSAKRRGPQIIMK